jgi:beta-lactamase class A
MPPVSRAPELDDRLRTLEARLPSGALGVSVYDALSGGAWSYNGDRSFHAASVIKVAVLAALFDAVRQGRFTLDCRLHVRNRFLSSLDGTPFRVDSRRDADVDVHASIGRTMRLRELARHMIVTSSNLATNLLLDLVTVDAARATIGRLGITGVDLRRGVEDDRAFDAGITNRVTPNGACALLKVIVQDAFLPAHVAEMLDILHGQQFSGAIAAGLPEPIRAVSRVAHKTGEISTVTHDAGIVFLPGRPPYVVAVLVESTGDARERLAVGEAASAAVYDCVAAAGEGAGR